MDTGCFYFLLDDYFLDFPDKYLMSNKDRPCFYSFYDDKTNIYWLIPFSSKVEKYKAIYQKKVSKYGKCDTILFGDVLGYEKAFLIQNMCPAIPKYIKNKYIDAKTNVPVKLRGDFEKELIYKAKLILNLVRKGKQLIFPDVLKIESSLIVLMASEKQVAVSK